MKRPHASAGVVGGDLWLRALDLDEGVLLAEARRRTRLEDFAEDETFHEALGRLIHSYETEAHLNVIGRLIARQGMIRLLVNRLSLVRDRARHPEIGGHEIRTPLFLTGLPRSGTMLLHALLAQDPENRVPLQWEVALPSPPPERDSRGTDPRIVAVERQLLWFRRLQPSIRRMHWLAAARLPAECATITSHSFMSFGFDVIHDVPTYEAWLETRDLVCSYAWHRRFLQHLQWQCPRARWVLRAPAHLFGLASLFATYPDATVVFAHRDPLEASQSLARLAVVLRSAFSDAVDPVTVGRNMTERWATAMERACHYRDTGPVPAGRFLDVRYTDLLRDPVGTVRRLYAEAQWEAPSSNTVAERIHRFVDTSAADAQHPGGDSAAEFGLEAEWIRERYRWYRERFAV
jgi:sulfotransferase family protein